MAFLALYPGTHREQKVPVTSGPMVLGRSTSCDLELNDLSVSDRHARIEQVGGAYYVVDLSSTNGTEVNGKPIERHLLHHGDRVHIGDVPAWFLLDPDEHEATRPAMTEPTARQPTSVSLGPHHGAYPGAPLPPGSTVGFGGAGMLPLLAFLAAATVIAFPLALVLGAMAHARINQFGGTRQDRRLTNWALGLSVLWLLLGVTGVGLVVHRARTQAAGRTQLEQMSANELAVIRALKGLACAQRYAHAVEIKDRDEDARGEYLELEELASTGSSFFDPDLVDGEAYDYRFLMVQASEDQFLAVAEPLVPGGGQRTFAVDQSGQLRAGDSGGVPYAGRTAPLPVLQGERNAYYELGDEMAQDIMAFAKHQAAEGGDLEKVDRILQRLRDDFTLSEVGQELTGVKDTTDRFLKEKRAQQLYDEAKTHLAEGRPRAALSLLSEIVKDYQGFSLYAESVDQLARLNASIREEEETAARTLMRQADDLEGQGRQEEAKELYQRIELQYAETETGQRVMDLKGDFDRQVREKSAEKIFFEMMELNPRTEFRRVISLADQLERNYRDTDLYDANRGTVDDHARKARAEKWRNSTRADMEQGHTRGALARLEAAARENADIRFDLRDLFIDLYQEVGARLVEEGDDREALRVFMELQDLVQGTEQADLIRDDLIAELNRKVGSAEFEKENYGQARWHLANAAWRYQDDAFFNLRYGVANLYEGQYAPALEAISRAARLEPELEQACLYRAYLQMRTVGYLERLIVSAFRRANVVEMAEVAPSADKEEGEDEDEMTLPPGPVLNVEIVWDAFASPIPEPKDMDLDFEYDYAASSRLLPETIKTIRRLYAASDEFSVALDESRGEGRGKADDERMRQFLELADYRNRVSQMRTLAKRDERSRQSFQEVLSLVERSLARAASDLQAASRLEPRLKPLTARLYGRIMEKHANLQETIAAVKKNNHREIALQDKAISYAQKLLTELQQGSTRSLGARYIGGDLMRQAADRSDLDAGLLALETALEIRVDVEDIRRSAEHTVSPVEPADGIGRFL